MQAISEPARLSLSPPSGLRHASALLALFAMAALPQCLVLRNAPTGGPLVNAAAALSYAAAALLAVLLLGGAAKEAAAPGEPTRREWLLGSARLFRSGAFRSLVPGTAVFLLTGCLVASGELYGLIRLGSVAPGRAAAVTAAILLFSQCVTYFVLWLVTVLLAALVVMAVRGSADFRYLAALSGYAYWPLPLVVAALLAYQFGWVADAAGGTDARVLLPALMALKATEAFAFVTLARGLARGPEALSYPAAFAVACAPFAAIPLGRLGFALLG
jgi:hypothetical protein